MKKILFLITLQAVVGCSDNMAIFESDFAKMKGVKTMTITEIEPVAKFNEIIPGDTLMVTIYEYDEDGKPLSIESYDEDGLSGTCTFSWEGNKSKMSYEYYYYSLWNVRKVADKGYCERTYDSEGRETLFERFKEPDDTLDLRIETAYEFDKAGRVEAMYRNVDAKTDTTYFIPEKSGGMTKIIFNSVFGIDKKSEEIYDKHGNLLKSIIYNDRNGEQVRGVFSYDIEYNEIDRPAKVIKYRGDEPSFIYCYEYGMY